MDIAYIETREHDGVVHKRTGLVTSPEELVLNEGGGKAVAEELGKTSFGKTLLTAFDDHIEKGHSFADPSRTHERLHPFEDKNSYMFHKDQRVVKAMRMELETAATEPDSIRNALCRMKRDFLLFFSRIIYRYFGNLDRVISYDKRRHKTSDDEEFARRYAELDADTQFSLLLQQPQIASLLRIEDFRETTADGVGRVIEDGTDTVKRRPAAHSTINGSIVIDEVDRLFRTEERIKQLFKNVPEDFRAYIIHAARSFLGELNANRRNKILRKTSNVLDLIGDEFQRNAARNCLDELEKEIDIYMSIYSCEVEGLEGREQKPKISDDLPGHQAQAIPNTDGREEIEKRRPESSGELARLLKPQLKMGGAVMFYTDEQGQPRSTDDDDDDDDGEVN